MVNKGFMINRFDIPVVIMMPSIPQRTILIAGDTIVSSLPFEGDRSGQFNINPIGKEFAITYINRVTGYKTDGFAHKRAFFGTKFFVQPGAHVLPESTFFLALL